MRQTSGFTLLEVMFSAFVLILAIVGLSSAIAISGQARQVTRTNEAVDQYLADKIAGYRSMLATDVVTRAATEGNFTNIGTNDALTVPAGYTLPKAMPAGAQRMVEVLSEQDATTEFGLSGQPLDLDQDGVSNENSANSARNNYVIAPIRVTVRWPTGKTGVFQTVSAVTVIYPSVTNE